MNISVKSEYVTRQLRDGGLDLLEVSGVRGLDLSKTFDCGQCFRFEPVENSRHECEWGGIAHGRAVSFASEGDKLYIYNAKEGDFYSVWRHYLGLDTDYDAIERDILSRSDSESLAKAVEYGRGIRILAQEHWETLCSFIISQNNNIKRITKTIEKTCELIGEKRLSNFGEYYAFPTASAFLTLSDGDYKALGYGYRAKFIKNLATMIVNGFDVNAFSSLDYSALITSLTAILGVGEKVANCVSLFGFSKMESFPVDTWIEKIYREDLLGTLTDRKKITKELTQKFGAYSGYYQQYLFYYKRNFNPL